MRQTRTLLLTGLATAAALIWSAAASAVCGDLNNSGGGTPRTLADLAILADCADGTCPTVTGGVCGTGNLIDCADLFGDNDVSVGAALTADLGVLGQSLAGITPLYDLCAGPGGPPSNGADDCTDGSVTLGTPVPQTINASQTWPSDCDVTIGGTVFVETDPGDPTTVLRVEAGSVVTATVGTPLANPAALIVLPGARVDFQGTQASPIVFTSAAAPGSRNKGDWGGISISGRSTVNGPDCLFVTEGLPVDFGGCIANDNSGIATFVRVEFAGLDFTANNELNLWTMNAVGSQTQFNFIQANTGDDDCHEWFGGTSHHTNLVASGCADDGLDFQLGFTGSVQFALMAQNGVLTDIVPNTRDSRGFEGDNSEFDPDAEPVSDPDFCNVTVLGGNRQGNTNAGSDSGVLLRRGTRATLANLIVTGFNDAGAELRDVSTTDEACVDANNDGIPESIANVVIRNSAFYDNGSSAFPASEQPKDNDGTLDTTSGCDLNACVAANCNCDSEAWYNLLVSSFDVENPCGSNAINPGVSSQYPVVNNMFCTGAGAPFACCTGPSTGTCDGTASCTGAATPFPCCTGAGTGSCNINFDFLPTTPLADPPPANCSTINARFVNTSYIGAFNPTAPCSSDAQCDWLTTPWISFETN